jgi:hypothetical protein
MLDISHDCMVILACYSGKKNGNLEIVIPALVRLASHNDPLAFDPPVFRMGQFQYNTHLRHQGYGPDRVAQDAIATDIVDMIQHAGSGIIHKDAKSAATARISSAFIPVVSYHAGIPPRITPHGSGIGGGFAKGHGARRTKSGGPRVYQGLVRKAVLA